jgi:hypothetical protein
MPSDGTNQLPGEPFGTRMRRFPRHRRKIHQHRLAIHGGLHPGIGLRCIPRGLSCLFEPLAPIQTGCFLMKLKEFQATAQNRGQLGRNALTVSDSAKAELYVNQAKARS